jgi:hypothetical protein
MKRDDALLFEAVNMPSKGAACGLCIFRLEDEDACAILTRKRVSMKTGVCGFFIWGDPIVDHKVASLSDEEAGYVENAAPSQCANCFYFARAGDSSRGWCHELDTAVSARMCCNAWEPIAQKMKEEEKD